MDRHDYYHRQTVTDTELDEGFDYAENADWLLASDHDLVRIVSGYTVSPGGLLTVNVAAGTAYDKDGKRLALAALQNVSIATDHLGLPTAVVGPGNEKIISIFIEFDRLLSDPRTDGNGDPVDFLQEEAVAFHVVQGVEGPNPATPPALDASRILLADITLIFGQAVVAAPDISTDRREHAFSIDKTNFSYTAGTALEAIDLLADEVDSVMGVEAITLVIPATAAVAVIQGTGTISLADSNRTLTTLGSTEEINVPILGLQVGDVIKQVTARFRKAGASVANARVEEFFQGLTANLSNTAPTPAASGSQNAVINAPSPAFFPKTVVTGATYWCHMYAADNGDRFISVEVEIDRTR